MIAKVIIVVGSSGRSFIIFIICVLYCSLILMMVVSVVNWLFVMVTSFWLHLEHEITSLDRDILWVENARI